MALEIRGDCRDRGLLGALDRWLAVNGLRSSEWYRSIRIDGGMLIAERVVSRDEEAGKINSSPFPAVRCRDGSAKTVTVRAGLRMIPDQVLYRCDDHEFQPVSWPSDGGCCTVCRTSRSQHSSIDELVYADQPALQPAHPDGQHVLVPSETWLYAGPHEVGAQVQAIPLLALSCACGHVTYSRDDTREAQWVTVVESDPQTVDQAVDKS